MTTRSAPLDQRAAKCITLVVTPRPWVAAQVFAGAWHAPQTTLVRHGMHTARIGIVMPISFSDEDDLPTDATRDIVPRSEKNPPASDSVPALVLVVDDDDDNRELVACLLRCDGYDVLEAHDGQEALDLMLTSEKTPAMIVSDVRMPHVTGLELLQHLRQEGYAIPLVFMTGQGTREFRIQAEGLGATAVFQKPVDVDDLRTAVLNLAHAPTLP